MQPSSTKKVWCVAFTSLGKWRNVDSMGGQTIKQFSENIPFTDINPNQQTVPMFLNNRGTIVARSKADYIYIKNEKIVKINDQLEKTRFN